MGVKMISVGNENGNGIYCTLLEVTKHAELSSEQ